MTARKGAKRTYKGQVYRCLGEEPYWNPAGEFQLLLAWESECATCGETFKTLTPKSARSFSRRCRWHRQPGVRVTDERKRDKRRKAKKTSNVFD